MKKKLLASLLAMVMVLGLVPITAMASFADTEGHWGEDAIDRWAAEGVLNGKGEDEFDPDGRMTRAEFAQMLCNLMGYTKKAPNTYTDIPDSAWYADAMLKLVAAGVINGVGDNKAAPNDPITREQAAVMLCRAFNLKTSSSSLNFADSSKVSSWARDAVATLAELGMMNGVGNNQVAPQLNIDRASVATLIDNMVAEYVTENKTISGEVDGIIVIAADVTVTFEDATLNAPVIVAPAAEGADVKLSGATSAGDIVVAAEDASVTVGKDATAETVTAAADKAEVKVEGTVDTVAVEGDNAKVNVTGAVDTVAVEGESAKVSVSGTVEKVDVAEGADKAEVTAASGGKIDSVTTAAEDVKVSGSGEVGTVNANDGSVDVTVKDAVVNNNGADKATAGNKDVAAGESETVTTTPSTGGGSGGGGSQTASVDVKPAPLADHNANPIANTNNELGTVRVSATESTALVMGEGGSVTTPGVYAVTITGTNIMKHNNSTQTESGDAKHWVGFAVPFANDDGQGYTFCNGDTAIDTATNRYIDIGGKNYTTIYFDDEDQASTKTIKVKKDSGTNLVATYTVTFDVNFYKPTAKVRTVTDDDLAANEGWVKPAILTLNAPTAAANEISVTVREITNISNLITWTDKHDTAAQYSYYFLSWDDENINKITFTSADGVQQPAPVTQFLKTEKAVCAFKVIQGNATKKVTHTFTAVDAAGREQGTFTVTLDSTGATLPAGTVSVKFMDGSTTVSTVIVAGDKVTTPVAPTAPTGKVFDGWQKQGTDTKVNPSTEIDATEAATYVAVWKDAEYTVTVTSPPNGTVTADPTTAKYKDEITLTITPDADYEVDTITVKDASGNDVTVTDNKFRMPGSNVTVTVTFKAIEYTVKFDGVDAEDTTVTFVGDNAGKVSVTTPTNEGTTYYTGNWKQGSTVLKPADGKVTVTKPESGTEIVLAPEAVAVEAVQADTRTGGTYGTVYTTAGMAFNKDTKTITVNKGTLEGYIKNASNAGNLAMISVGSQYVMYGVQFPGVDSKATKAYYSFTGSGEVSVPAAGTDFSKWTFTEGVETVSGQAWRQTDLAVDDANSYQKNYVDYVHVATYAESDGNTTVTFPANQTRNYVVVYLDGSNNVVAIHTATVIRDITAPAAD